MALRLTTLGGLALADGDGAPLPAAPPRRRLVLLAVIAASGPRGISREKLLAWFWPEGAEERARHALTQTLYALRRDLGGREVVSGTSTLHLVDAAVRADVAALEAALDRHDHDAAVALYRGPFLDGVHLGGLPELERWIDEERTRLARRMTDALEARAEAADRDGDRAEAARRWRALAALDPMRARYALGLMHALAALGERAAAVRHARVYATLVREELGVEPDPAVEALATQLASELAEPMAAPESAASAPVVEPAPPPEMHAALPPPRPGPRWRRAALAAAVLAAVALVVAAWQGADGNVARPREWVLVADFENATGDTLFDRSLSLALADALGQAERVSIFSRARVREVLTLMGRQAPGEPVVDEAAAREVAERAGIRLLVVPSIARFDRTYLVAARIVDAANGQALASEQARAGGRAEVLDALDALVRQLRRRLGDSRLAVRAAAPLPPATTRSLEALKLFAEAQRAFNAADYNTAEALYEAALAQDSTFALAHANLGELYAWVNRNPDAEPHFARALALLDGLPERERLIVRARVAGWRGDRVEQISTLRALLQRHPTDMATRSDLAYAYLRHHEPARARTLYRELLATDSTNASAWINLATASRAMEDVPGALDAYRRAFALDPKQETNDNLNNEYGGALVRAGRMGEARATFARMLALGPNQQLRGLRSLAYLAMVEGRFAVAADDLQRAAVIARAQELPLSEARTRLLRALTLDAVGRAPEARAERDAAWDVFRAKYLPPTMLMWLGADAARAGERTRARVLLDSIRRRGDPRSDDDRVADAVLSAEIAAADGRGTEAAERLATAFSLDSSAYVLDAVAHAAARRGDLRAAERLYATLAAREDFGWEGQLPRLFAPAERARLLERLGDDAGARASWRQVAARWPSGDAALLPLADARRRAPNASRSVPPR